MIELLDINQEGIETNGSRVHESGAGTDPICGELSLMNPQF